MLRIVCFMIMFFSCLSVQANITLYTCIKGGVSVLVDKPIKGCEQLIPFTYETVQPLSTSLNDAQTAVIKTNAPLQ